MVACILWQMVMDQKHWKEYTRPLPERQERQMVNHPATQRSPSPMLSEMSWTSVAWQGEARQSKRTETHPMAEGGQRHGCLRPASTSARSSRSRTPSTSAHRAR
jgi:hypothetical protein